MHKLPIGDCITRGTPGPKRNQALQAKTNQRHSRPEKLNQGLSRPPKRTKALQAKNQLGHSRPKTCNQGAPGPTRTRGTPGPKYKGISHHPSQSTRWPSTPDPHFLFSQTHLCSSPAADSQGHDPNLCSSPEADSQDV